MLITLDNHAKENLDKYLQGHDYYIQGEARREIAIVTFSLLIGFMPLINIAYVFYIIHEHDKLIDEREQLFLGRVKTW